MDVDQLLVREMFCKFVDIIILLMIAARKRKATNLFKALIHQSTVRKPLLFPMPKHVSLLLYMERFSLVGTGCLECCIVIVTLTHINNTDACHTIPEKLIPRN